MSNNNIKTWVYTLHNEKKWLGEVVLTSDGMFAAVTDWGNASFSWRATGEKDFREFIVRLYPDYFGTKMFIGQQYIAGSSRKIEKACWKFAEMILPALRDAIRAELLAEAEARTEGA